LLTAWPKLNTGPRSNQTKALPELRRKCGKGLAKFNACELIIRLRGIQGPFRSASIGADVRSSKRLPAAAE
jgi:hypothetical protein